MSVQAPVAESDWRLPPSSHPGSAGGIQPKDANGPLTMLSIQLNLVQNEMTVYRSTYISIS